MIVGAAVSVQVGAGLATGLVRAYAPITIVCLRLLFSAALLSILRPPGHDPRSGSAWRLAIALGGVFVFMNAAFYVAISRLPLGVAVTIEFWGPLAIAVIGSRRPLDLVWVVLAGAGIYLLAGGGLAATDSLGVAAALAAGAGWMLFIVVGGAVGRAWPDGRGLTVALLVASAIVVPLALALGDAGSIVAHPGDVAIAAGVAVFSSALPWSLEVAALSRMRGATYGVIMSLEPAIAAVAGFVIIGQLLQPAELLAIAMVAIASAGASLSARAAIVTLGELENA